MVGLDRLLLGHWCDRAVKIESESMLTTQQKTLRRFWYATMPVSYLADGPKPFRLMNEDIVLFLGADDQPAALRDRCCHRTAKLSKGRMDGGNIVCGYHGWTYDRAGKLLRIPQYDATADFPRYNVDSFHCQSRYGYVWVALDEPLLPLFDIPEDGAEDFRRIFQFYDQWQTAPLRMMENSFDDAHSDFVHRGTFGDNTQPKPSKNEIEETDYGFVATTVVDIVNPPAAYRVTGSTHPTTTRTIRNHWYLPFARRMDITYPSGIRHIIINCATPIEDDRMQLVQLLYRNDTEGECPTQTLIDWDAAVVHEDRNILETTDPDAALDLAHQTEAHVTFDRPGLIMRRRLLELLKQHNDPEVTRNYVVSAMNRNR
jgi:phenylpropionate dioxygenase-like ring-hydroxylating dioxygenase large terminal subunit